MIIGERDHQTLIQKAVLALATGFGLGRIPVASGTFGSLPGFLLAFGMSGWHIWFQVAACVLLAILSVFVCDRAEEYFGRKDDGRIVADEYMTFPICLLGVPWLDHPWLLIPAFVVARAMDIVKIPPARQSQHLKGGLGITMDDIIAGLYALAINHLLVKFLYWRGVL